MLGLSQAQVITYLSSHLRLVWIEVADFQSLHEQWARPARGVSRHSTRLFQIWHGEIQ